MMNKYREVWDESHYKFDNWRSLQHTTWEQTNKKLALNECFMVACIVMSLFYIMAIFN